MRTTMILLLCCSLAFGDQISQEKVGADADDATVLRGGGALDATGQTVLVGANISGLGRWGFFRFQTIPIPAGSTIDSAIFTPTCATTNSLTTVNASLFCIDSADAAAPTDSTWLFNAAKTTAVSYWANLPSMTNGTAYRWGGSSGLVTGPVAEVMALAGWASNNDIVIVIKDSGSTANRARTFVAYPHISYTTNEATLDIYYTPPAGGPPSHYHGVAGIGVRHSPQGNSVLHKK